MDALAVAIGNAHDNYPVAPRLAFNVLEEIHKRVNILLVLHGGAASQTRISARRFNFTMLEGEGAVKKL